MQAAGCVPWGTSLVAGLLNVQQCQGEPCAAAELERKPALRGFTLVAEDQAAGSAARRCPTCSRGVWCAHIRVCMSLHAVSLCWLVVIDRPCLALPAVLASWWVCVCTFAKMYTMKLVCAMFLAALVCMLLQCLQAACFAACPRLIGYAGHTSRLLVTSMHSSNTYSCCSLRDLLCVVQQSRVVLVLRSGTVD